MVKLSFNRIIILFFFLLRPLYAESICDQYDFNDVNYRQRVTELSVFPANHLIYYLLNSENEWDEQLLIEITSSLGESSSSCISSSVANQDYLNEVDLSELLDSAVFQRSKFAGPTFVRSALVKELALRMDKRDNLDLSQNYQHYKKNLLWIVKGKDEVSKDNFISKVKTKAGNFQEINVSERLTSDLYLDFEKSKKAFLRELKLQYLSLHKAFNQTSQYFDKQKELSDLLNKYPIFKYYQNDFSYADFANQIDVGQNVDLFIEDALNKLNEKISLFVLGIYNDHSNRLKTLNALQSLQSKSQDQGSEIVSLVNQLEAKSKEALGIYQKYHSREAILKLVQSKMIIHEMTKNLGDGRTLVANHGLSEIQGIYNNHYLPAQSYVDAFNKNKARFSQLASEITPLQKRFLEGHARYIHKKVTLLASEIRLELKDKNVLDDLAKTIASDFSRSFPFGVQINEHFSYPDINSKFQGVLALEAQLLKSVGNNGVGIFKDQLNRIDAYSSILTKQGGRIPNNIFEDIVCGFVDILGQDCDGSITDPFSYAFQAATGAAKDAIGKVVSIAGDVGAEIAKLGHNTVESVGKIIEATKIDNVIHDIAEGVANLGEEVADAIDHNISELIDEGEQFATDFVNDPVGTLVRTTINGTIAPIAAPIILVTDPDRLLTHPGDAIDDFREATGDKIGAELERTFEHAGDVLEDVRDISEDALEHAWKDAVKLSTEVWDFSGEMIDDAKELAGKGVDIAQDVAFFAAKPLRQLDKDTYDKLKNRLDGWTDHAVASMFDAANPTRSLKVDTYRKIYNGHKKVIMDSVRDISKLNSKLTRKLNEEVLAKISKDLAKELERVVSLSEDGVDIVDATTSFENVAKTAMMYVGSTVGGPAGAALANMLADRFILKKKMSEGDLLKSFAIGMTAGYAGEFAAGFAESGSILSASYSNVANRISQDVGGVIVNGDSYSSDEFAKSLVQGVTSGVIGAQDMGGGSIGNASLTSMNNYVVNQLIEGESIDVNEAMRRAMEGGSQAALDDAVEDVLSRADLPQRLDKELYEAVKEKLAKFGEDENVMTEEMMLLQQKEFEETLNKLIELMEKHKLEQGRGPAFAIVGTAFVLTQMGLAVYELYSFYEKASNDPHLKAFIDEVKRTSLQSALENADFKKMVENYYPEIIGASITALGGPALKALSKVKNLTLINKIVEKAVIYGKKGLNSKFITEIGDLVLKYKLDTVEKIELVFDMATEFVKKQGGKLGDIDLIFDSAGKLFGNSLGKEQVKNYAKLSKELVESGAGKIYDLESIAKAAGRTKKGMPLLFDADNAVRHFKDHADQVKKVFNKSSYNLKQYMVDANHVVKTGQYSKEFNAYVKIVGGPGDAKAAFVGLKNAGENISTFHIKDARWLSKKDPSLGWSFE